MLNFWIIHLFVVQINARWHYIICWYAFTMLRTFIGRNGAGKNINSLHAYSVCADHKARMIYKSRTNILCLDTIDIYSLICLYLEHSQRGKKCADTCIT
jgi:hypothetical protein